MSETLEKPGEKLNIALCMGSSCFARGNQTVLETLEDMIADNGWSDRIHLSGLRCENKCSEGPNIKIDGQLYQALDTGALLDLIAKKLGVEPVSAKTTTRISAVRRPAANSTNTHRPASARRGR